MMARTTHLAAQSERFAAPLSPSDQQATNGFEQDREPTVFVVEDDLVVRRTLESLVRQLGFQVSAFADGQTFLDRFRSEQPGCVLLDLNMPEFSGLQVQARLRQHSYVPPVVVISGSTEVPLAVEAMKLGAIDFLRKPVSRQQMQRVVTIAIELDQRLRRQWQQHREVQIKLNKLNAKERVVLDLLVKGLLNKQIAASLDVTSRTVELRRASIFRKLEVANVGELMRFIYVWNQISWYTNDDSDLEPLPHDEASRPTAMPPVNRCNTASSYTESL